MMTHTLGPWTVDDNYIMCRYEELDLCRMLGRGEETDANARLIAAAPDLLAACDDAVQALMLLSPDCLDDVDFSLSRNELINNIFSAIARARPE